MTVKRRPCDTAVVFLAITLLAACEVDDTTSRVPPDGGGGGGVDDDGGGEGEGEAADPGDPFVSCVPAGAVGNEHGVGKHCTPKGGQCSGIRANFCHADFYPDETSTGCLFSCTASEQCGEGATCRPFADPDEVGGECVPTECLAIES